MAIRWKALASQRPVEELEQSYRAAPYRGERLWIGADCLFWQQPLGSVAYLPFADMERAYIREEEQYVAMGCRRIMAPVASLAVRLKTGEVKTFTLGEREQVERALEALKELAPELAFGFVKT